MIKTYFKKIFLALSQIPSFFKIEFYGLQRKALKRMKLKPSDEFKQIKELIPKEYLKKSIIKSQQPSKTIEFGNKPLPNI